MVNDFSLNILSPLEQPLQASQSGSQNCHPHSIQVRRKGSFLPKIHGQDFLMNIFWMNEPEVRGPWH